MASIMTSMPLLGDRRPKVRMTGRPAATEVIRPGRPTGHPVWLGLYGSNDDAPSCAHQRDGASFVDGGMGSPGDGAFGAARARGFAARAGLLTSCVMRGSPCGGSSSCESTRAEERAAVRLRSERQSDVGRAEEIAHRRVDVLRVRAVTRERADRGALIVGAAVVLFGVPETKDAVGSQAWDPDGIVQVALSDLRDELGDEANAAEGALNGVPAALRASAGMRAEAERIRRHLRDEWWLPQEGFFADLRASEDELRRMLAVQPSQDRRFHRPHACLSRARLPNMMPRRRGFLTGGADFRTTPCQRAAVLAEARARGGLPRARASGSCQLFR